MHAILLAVLSLAAAPAPAPSAEAWLKGRVERTGTVYTPQLNLVSDEGKRYEVIGELTTELGGLEGAKLEIRVVRERDGWQLPRVRALAYKILDIGGGDRPEIGIVSVDGEQVSLVVDAQKTLKLQDTALAKRLRSRPGEKVWVVGKLSGGLFKISRAGYLGVPKASASQPAVVQPTMAQPATEPAPQ